MSEYLYRTRIVFNGPVNREHCFYGLAKRTQEEIRIQLQDLAPALRHAVSVTVQRKKEASIAGWRTLSAWDDWESVRD